MLRRPMVVILVTSQNLMSIAESETDRHYDQQRLRLEPGRHNDSD